MANYTLFNSTFFSTLDSQHVAGPYRFPQYIGGWWIDGGGHGSKGGFDRQSVQPARDGGLVIRVDVQLECGLGGVSDIVSQ